MDLTRAQNVCRGYCHLVALKIYGRKWKKIEKFIGTRTSTQIRSHAQKYFIKLNKVKSKANSLYREKRTFVNALEQKPEESYKDQCIDTDYEAGTKKPFLITIHKSAISEKHSEQNTLWKELNELESAAIGLDKQLKELGSVGGIFYNLPYLLWQSNSLMNSILALGCKVSSKKQMGKILI